MEQTIITRNYLTREVTVRTNLTSRNPFPDPGYGPYPESYREVDGWAEVVFSPKAWAMRRNTYEAIAREYTQVTMRVITTGAAEICTSACQNGKIENAADCECVCQGLYHGGDVDPRWEDKGPYLVKAGYKELVRVFERGQQWND